MSEPYVLHVRDGDTAADVITLLREHGYDVSLMRTGHEIEYRVK